MTALGPCHARAAPRGGALAAAGLTLGLLLAPPPAPAQDPELEISLEASSSEIDRRNERLIFNDVDIRQGDLSIRAKRAIGNGISFDDSDWTFSGAVELTSRDGSSIDADEAVLSFRANQLTRARLVGSPVTFQRASTQVEGQVARGRAARVDYDLTTSSLRLSGNAWLCEGGNEITSETIVYDIAAERVLADSSDEGGDGRVRIIITPSSEQGDTRECGPPPPWQPPTAGAAP
jgi:lipopolysaccharide export system protein LptA